METLAEVIASYQTALDRLAAGQTDSAQTLAILLARDAVAAAMSRGQPTAAQLQAVAALDTRLQANTAVLDRACGRATLAAWRAARQPPAGTWWWQLDERAAEAGKPSPIWTVIAGFFLAVSLSLTADIARRFLAAGPDFVGVFSTISQVFFTFMAGRSLTGAGQRSLERLLARANIHARYAHVANAGLALLILLAVASLRLSLPAIARSYNDTGVRQQQSGQVSAAIQNYQRAISLSQFYAQAHYNLATAYEQSLTNDLAIASYQASLRSDSRNIPAYNNLARVYLSQNSYGNALVLLNTALDLDAAALPETGRDAVLYSLYKNRGWANLGLQYVNQAENDVRRALEARPDGAAAHCLMAQVLEARNDRQGALPWWETCLAYEKLDVLVPAEARWLGLAQERLSEAAKK